MQGSRDDETQQDGWEPASPLTANSANLGPQIDLHVFQARVYIKALFY